MTKKPKVLLIGWDAADWSILRPLLEAGKMPALQRLIDRGVMGNIATLDPPLSPMLWTSIATGKTADKHGILGFVEPDTEQQDIRPVSVRSRKVKAIWNILSQQGLKTHVAGWWPSHPAEPVNGVYISDYFSKTAGAWGEDWPLPPNCIHPPELEAILRDCRVHPGELTLAHLLPFVPDATKIDQDKDSSLGLIASLIASCSSYHAAMTWALEHKEWDFAALYLDSVDKFCHGFIKYHPPQLPGIPDNLQQLYHGVVEAAYRFHDMMLERLVELAGEDTTIVLMSDHGYRSGDQRLKIISKEPAGPAQEHAPYGILCISGPNIRRDERVYGATLLDITPTLLSVFGLPVGEDMDGRVLTQIFETPVTPSRIPSWEAVEGPSGQLPAETQEDPWAAREAMKQLQELGYVEAPGEDAAKRLKNTEDESRFYLARVYQSTGRKAQALPLLQALWDERKEFRYGLHLAGCLQQLERPAEAQTVIDALRGSAAGRPQPMLDYLEASLLLAAHRPRRAIGLLQRALESGSRHASVYLLIGRCALAAQQWSEAEQAFLRALALDADNAYAHHGLAQALLRTGRADEAASAALDAIGLLFHFPAAHHHLGEALMACEDYPHAAQAFETSIAMAPNNRKARRRLIHLYETHLPDAAKAAAHRDFIAGQLPPETVIVCGLPRSGTSMIMQMLHAGGYPVLTDGQRRDDDHNPKGYLEFEPVKSIQRDNTWMEQAENKAVKVVAPLLPFLPKRFRYSVIFIHRDLHEVLHSQQRMLGKNPASYSTVLADAFHQHVAKAEAWIAAQPDARVLHLEYAAVVAAPREAAEAIASFLGEPLDTEAMTAAVETSLYRNRLATETKN